MNKYILTNNVFLLGVEENWDTYHEVTVRFVEKVNIGEYTYYLFVDIKTDEHFYLRPRYAGHRIEGISAEKRIVVNLFKRTLDVDPGSDQQPQFYATGLLQLPNN